jgi:Flp pilus assembly protein TadD
VISRWGKDMSLIEKALMKANREEGLKGPEINQGEPDESSILSSPAKRKKRLLLPSLILLLIFLGAFLWVVFFSPISPFLKGQISQPPAPQITKGNKEEKALAKAPLIGLKKEGPISVTPVKSSKEKRPMKEEEGTKKEAIMTPIIKVKTTHHEGEKKTPPIKSDADHSLSSTPAGPHFTSQDKRLELLYEKGFLYGQAGRFTEAIEFYNEFLSYRPDHFEALLNRGILKQKIGDLKGAEMDLLKAREKRPVDPTLLNALGVLYMETGRKDEAITMFRESHMATSLINLSLLYWKEGDWEKVISTLHEAEQIEPQNPYIFYYRGIFLIQTGKNVLARQELEKAGALARKKGMRELAERIESVRTGL